MKKKAFVTTGYVSFWVYLGIALLFLLFLVIFNLTGNALTSKIETEQSNSDAEYLVKNLLRAPVTFQDSIYESTMTYADLFVLYFEATDKNTEQKEEFEVLLREKNKEVMSLFPETSWSVWMSDPTDWKDLKRVHVFKSEEGAEKKLSLVMGTAIVKTYLPYPSEEHPIIIGFIFTDPNNKDDIEDKELFNLDET